MPGEEAYDRFRAFEKGGSGDGLEGWVVADGADLSRRYHFRIVSLETMTACNRKCYFCPVSIAPRADYTMPDEFFHHIVEQLVPFRPTLESVFLQSYNEPTLDRRFLDQCRTLFAAGLPVALLSNGAGFTPAKPMRSRRRGRSGICASTSPRSIGSGINAIAVKIICRS